MTPPPRQVPHPTLLSSQLENLTNHHPAPAPPYSAHYIHQLRIDFGEKLTISTFTNFGDFCAILDLCRFISCQQNQIQFGQLKHQPWCGGGGTEENGSLESGELPLFQLFPLFPLFLLFQLFPLFPLFPLFNAPLSTRDEEKIFVLFYQSLFCKRLLLKVTFDSDHF